MSDFKVDQEVAGWRLLEWLGEGGNAEVWRSERDGQEAAVKILKTRKAESKRWQRFRLEVEYVAGLGETQGVLLILSYDLPDAPKKGERAWYAMPLAQPLAAALTEATLREVVEAVLAISRTLSELAARDGAAHRDIKPSNLYLWEGRPAIGDFGLLWRPEQTDITGSDIPGAFSFTAPELFREDLEEDQIDYGLCDVFSLAKTLWALARGQEFATPGPHDADDPGQSIGKFRRDAFADALDRLIERATIARPERRPPMAEFGDELEQWMGLSEPTSNDVDLSGVAGQIREQIEPALEQERNQERLIEFGRSAVRRCREQLKPLFRQLDADLPNATTNVRDENVEAPLRTWEAMGEAEVLMRESICASISNMAQPLALKLSFGVLVEVHDDGKIRIGAAMNLGYEEVMQNESDQSPPREVEAGSVEDEAALQEVTQWIIDNVGEWLQKFAEAGSA